VSARTGVEDADAHTLVAAGLGVPVGQLGTLEERQVLRRPSGRVIVTWRTVLAGERREVVAVVGEGGPERGVLLLELPDGRPAAVFEPDDDPRLPGLHVATDVLGLTQLVGTLVLDTRRRRYRPLGRAVVEATTADGPLWVKVLRPSDVAAVASLHEAVAARVPGPPVVAVDEDRGLLVLGHLPGRDLRDLVRHDAGLLPPAADLLALSDDLAGVDLVAAERDEPSPRTAPLAAVDGHVRRLAGIVPDLAEEVEELAATITRLGAAVPPGPTVAIHGDLHAAQVHADQGRISGLLDLDDVGTGTQADDLGRFVGHLTCTVDDERGAAARPWAQGLNAAVLARVPGPALAPRVAAVVLGLATGPHRVNRPDWPRRTARRIELARGWVAPLA